MAGLDNDYSPSVRSQCTCGEFDPFRLSCYTAKQWKKP